MLATYLAWKGFNAIHTTHFSEGHLLQDAAISRITLDKDRIIVTKDADFPDAFFPERPTAPHCLSPVKKYAKRRFDGFF